MAKKNSVNILSFLNIFKSRPLHLFHSAPFACLPYESLEIIDVPSPNISC